MYNTSHPLLCFVMQQFDMRLQKDWVALRWRKGKGPKASERAFEPTTSDREEFDERRGSLKANMASVKQIACPPLNSRKVALLQEPGWVSGSVSGGGGGGGRKAALHSLAQSEYVSKGTVTAELCVGLSAEAESQSQTSPDFLAQSFYTRPLATAFPAWGDSSKSPEWFPWDRSEIHSRQWQCSSF